MRFSCIAVRCARSNGDTEPGFDAAAYVDVPLDEFLDQFDIGSTLFQVRENSSRQRAFAGTRTPKEVDPGHC